MAGEKKWPPRVVISAPQGRSGKTLVSIGLCAALVRRGLKVQPFKKGPDYIDPSWLTAASGRACRNLDTVLMSEEKVLYSFQHACRDADIAVIEGAMGLYDGYDDGEKGSTAHIAGLLGSPVILVVNASRMTQSVAAMVSGYQNFQPEIKIAGVILNNVAGARHREKLTAAIERHCGIPVVGAVPREKELAITERHLGLVPFPESGSKEIIERAGRLLEEFLDVDGILEIAAAAEERTLPEFSIKKPEPASVRIGVMQDKVFNFYYPENLEALADAGAEFVILDSLQMKSLPGIDGLYIGGGFPELFVEALEANSGLRNAIAEAVNNGLPVYAECAGLMYLCRAIHWQGKRYEMAGALPADVDLSERPLGHGYTTLEVVVENPFFPVGLTYRGHEFHHSRLVETGEFDYACRVVRGNGIDGKRDAIIYKRVFASYTHIHALGVPGWGESFASRAREYKRERS